MRLSELSALLVKHVLLLQAGLLTCHACVLLLFRKVLWLA
jgi:hypothetical protein